MKNKISYSKNPKDIAYAIKSSLVINDFLPPQDKLIIKGDTSKVKKNIGFLNDQSKKSGVSYQSLSKKFPDLYADKLALK